MLATGAVHVQVWCTMAGTRAEHGLPTVVYRYPSVKICIKQSEVHSDPLYRQCLSQLTSASPHSRNKFSYFLRTGAEKGEDTCIDVTIKRYAIREMALLASVDEIAGVLVALQLYPKQSVRVNALCH